MFNVQFKMALRNLRANWKHSLAAALSLASGFVALTLFESYFIRVKQLYRANFGARGMYGNLIVEKSGAQQAGLDDAVKYSLSRAEQKAIEGLLATYPEVTQTVRFLNLVGTAQSGANSGIILGQGYDVKSGREVRGDAWGWNANAGVPLDVDGGQKLLIGKTLATILGCKFDPKTTTFTAIGYYPPENRPFECAGKISVSTTTDRGQINALMLDVAGISDAGFSEIDSRYLMMPLETAQLLLDTDRISMFTVDLREGVKLDGFISRFSKDAKAAGLDLSIMDWAVHPYGDLYLRTLDYLRIFRGFVLIVIILIVTMSVLNTFMKVVVERTREIGTLRSLGYVPGFIVRHFAIEGVLLAFS